MRHLLRLLLGTATAALCAAGGGLIYLAWDCWPYASVYSVIVVVFVVVALYGLGTVLTACFGLDEDALFGQK